MKVKTLINRLLNYDMDVDVDLVIYGDNEERFSCTLNEIDIEEKQCLDYCVIILHSDQLKDDDDESIQDLILYKQGYMRLLNSRKNKLKKKESNDKRG